MVQIMPDKALDQLVGNAGQYLPKHDLDTVRAAYERAAAAHGAQQRASGDPYISHPVAVATILADLRMDVATLSAALLHDVVEDTSVSLAQIESEFGQEIARIVDGVTKLSRVELATGAPLLRGTRENEWAENIRKMVLAMAEDLRVVLVKLADRLHNMRTLQSLPPEKQRRIAQETMDIYAPLANRLGIWEVKWQLEDLSFRYLEPDAYREIARSVQTRRMQRERYIIRAVRALRGELETNGIEAEVFGRPKHLYSIYTKMENRGRDISQIYDLLALRVIVDSIPSCYHALGVIHGFWHPLPGEFDDYIASPKESGYQSLHTAVQALDGKALEIQIRTTEMNQVAEYGLAAHWRYKEGRRQDPRLDSKITWLRQLMDWQKDVAGGAEAFVDSLKTDVFQQQVYVFTPRGDIKEFPTGSTPVDFAYRIHTALGHRCVGAKVNGRLVPLSHQLQNGDIIEIITSKTPRGPSRDWLIPAFGFVKTTHAREKIRQWFRREAREESVARGRDLVDRELKRLGISGVRLDDVASASGYERLEDFLAAVGYGDLHPQQLASRMAALVPAPEPTFPSTPTLVPEFTGGVQVAGVADLFTRLARCCHPLPGDPIVGFITRGRGITVHHQSCSSVRNEDERERLVEVEWATGGKDKRLFPVTMRIVANDRAGLVRDIGAIVADEKLSIDDMSVAVQRDQTAVLTATLSVPDLERLSRVMVRIESIRDVLSVERQSA